MQRTVLMLALVVAGELVFGLVFNVPRFFRPTMLDVFGISNTELGDLFAIYGIVAMMAYFPGGSIADRYSARSLFAVSLISTSLGGVYMATIPGITGMQILYGFWGVTTIFLFWGALIRATRGWGGRRSQGVAFGILDGGRGVVAATAAALGVAILAFYMPEDARLANAVEREAGFRMVVLYYSLLTFLAGVFSWYAIPDDKRGDGVKFNPLKGMRTVLWRPIIWAQAGVIICAYCGYKGLDNFSLYAVQVLGMDEVDGARFASYGAWIRPLAAVLAGLAADRFHVAKSIGVLFAVLSLSFAAWSVISPGNADMAIVYLNFFVTYAAVYALRGVYFALLEDMQTPMHITGAAVGLISLLGYSPDIFFGPISGRILDANPGLPGHHNYFSFLALIAALGFLMILCLLWLRKRGGPNLWQAAAKQPR
jgi:nitrate/nitrite transporter NarK